MRRAEILVLSIGKLSPGRADYYLSTVAEGAEEYYVGSGEAPGRWLGRSAAALGLEGRVEGYALREVLDGSDGRGQRLIGRQGRDRMPGFDCTFNAPKSVSLIFALGSPEIRKDVSAAHDAAVDAAMAVFEDEAARARRGRGGAEIVRAGGFVAAAFRHRTSRSGDPHLHTHVVVANLAQVGQRWTALDGRQLYAWCRTTGFLYEAHLRAELTRRLGVEWERPRRGIADIAGIPRRVIDHFSQRRRQITEHMADLGSLGGHAAQVAAYATRKAKDASVPYQALKAWWIERAAALGVDQESLQALCDITTRQQPTRTDLAAEELFTRLDAPNGVTENQPTFDRRSVIRHICDLTTAGASTDEVLRLTDAYLESPEVVPLAEAGTDRMFRADGTSVPLPIDLRRFTTRDMLRQEAHLIEMAQHRQGDGAGLADPSAIEAAVAARPTLSDEQRAMVRRICSSGDGVEVVPGVAGSGKTFALAAVREAWEAAGQQVLGAALSAQAARQLQAGSDIPSSTIAALERDLVRPECGLGPQHVLVIDEAAMVGTRSLVTLVGHAHRSGAKIVLIGDACQLPEIEAGGGFAGLVRRADPAMLTVNRRQHQAWERQALSDLRLGHASEALHAYRCHDRIHHDPEPGRAVDDLIEHWWSARHAGSEALMLASCHENVTALNDQARRRMRSADRLGPEDFELGGRSFATGDEVLGPANATSTSPPAMTARSSPTPPSSNRTRSTPSSTASSVRTPKRWPSNTKSSADPSEHASVSQPGRADRCEARARRR